ncbi:MAG: carbohydrate ABC transporter permease [Oscillospiraceae bacterium]|nr:carbohydrate ABC transporter permease [Oscillospiraceae bacterium]
MMVNKKSRLGHFISQAVVLIIGIVMIYPLIWMFMSAFKETGQIFHTATSLIPEKWTLENYANGWNGVSGVTFGRFFLNSFIISGLGTVGALVSSSLVGYSFSRGRFKGRKLLFALMLSTLMLPAQVLMIPQFLWFNTLGWVGSYLPLIVPTFFAIQGFFVYLITNFMDGIPKELDEAAKIDGCSFYSIFARIILPLSVPALITAGIFSFIWKWDDFLGALLYVRGTINFPASLALRMFSDPSTATDWGAIFAMSILSLVPVVTIFITLQRYLVEGISTTGLK